MLGLLLAFILMLIWRFGILDVGEKVIVSYNGEVVAQYDLHASGRYELSFAEGRNVLMIEGGEAYVEEADCPDRLCVHQRHISKSGEAIICLPHKLVITIEGKEDAPSLDAVTN